MIASEQQDEWSAPKSPGTDARQPIPSSIHSTTRESSRITRPLFVCQTCGSIRNDQSLLPGQSPEWIAVKTYQKQRGVRLNEMPFILTYCPDCSPPGQEKASAYASAEQTGDKLHDPPTQPLDGLGDGLIALVGAIFSHAPRDNSWKACDAV